MEDKERNLKSEILALKSEILNIIRRMDEGLKVLVLEKQQNKTYNFYGFNLHLQDDTMNSTLGPWGSCTQSCGGGTQIRQVDANHMSESMEAEARYCNVDPCPCSGRKVSFCPLSG